MNSRMLFEFLFLVLFLSLSAYFAAVETALFSLDSIRIKRIAQDGRDTSLILKVLENPMRCLSVILFGNTLVNIAISAVITASLINILGDKEGLSVSIGVSTLLLLLFGEVTPKTVAIYNNERLAHLFAPSLYIFGRIVSPFLFLATTTCDAIISFFHLNLKKEPTLTEEEFKTVIEVGHRHGVVGKSEKDMVVSILELTATTAQEVMIPRMDIKAISVNWDRARALEFAREVRHSKLPVFKNSFDNILGFVNTKDIFLESAKPVKDLVAPLMFVPATKKISDLIREFYRQNVKMAVVVDEYGGTSGLVTLQDILDEIFGEIHDEFKVSEKLIEILMDGRFRLSGKAPIYKVNEDCELKIVPGDYETVAGYLLDVFGKIPSEGERIETAGGVFTIEKIMGRRIKSVLLEKK